MCKENKEEVLDINEDCDLEVETKERETPSFEDILGFMQVEEESDRIEIYNNYSFPKNLEKSVSADCKRDTVDIIYMVHMLKEAGLDYNNVVALSSNFVTNRHNREMGNVQTVQNQQNSI